jgi:hypothetical protein
MESLLVTEDITSRESAVTSRNFNRRLYRLPVLVLHYQKTISINDKAVSVLNKLNTTS